MSHTSWTERGLVVKRAHIKVEGGAGCQMAASAGPGKPMPPPGKPPGGLSAPRTSSLLVLCGLFALQLTAILASPIPRRGAATLGPVLTCAGLVFGAQLFNSTPGASSWPLWRRLGMLLAQGIFTYLPLAVLGVQWPGMAGFFAGSILMLMPPGFSLVPFAAVISSMLLAPPGLGADPRDAAYLMIASLSNGLTVYGISQLRLACERERGASIELAQLTSVRERERFSRDLHDFLGFSLSAITLKAELTRRLVGHDPALAHDELAEVAELARQAAADVRLVACGYRNVSLASEAATATSLLSSANIAVQVEIGCGALDDRIDTVLATVLREAVTNILRHSAARNCAIEANRQGEAITLEVTNDGVPRQVDRRTAGSGLENLAWRLEAIGGELSTGIRPDGRYSLRARVRLPESPWPGPAAGKDRRPVFRDRPINPDGGLSLSDRRSPPNAKEQT
jgi:two-component system, NarL family, sensor histidine kinase DesK